MKVPKNTFGFFGIVFLVTLSAGFFYIYVTSAYFDKGGPLIASPEWGSCLIDRTVLDPMQGIFRGADENQLRLEELISILLGGGRKAIPSKLYSYLIDLLRTGSASVPLDRPNLFAPIIGEIEKQRDVLPLPTMDEAEHVVQHHLTAYFQLLSNKFVKDNYLNYASRSRRDMPSDIVFATVSYPLATVYGNIVLHLNPSDRRFVNMWQWNMSWCNSMRHFADVGEILYPGFIWSSALDGFEVREQTQVNTAWRERANSPAKIIAFFKKAGDRPGKVLVYSGRRDSAEEKADCILSDAEKGVTFCRIKTLDGRIEREVSSPHSIAIIKKCHASSECVPLCSEIPVNTPYPEETALLARVQQLGFKVFTQSDRNRCS